MNCVKMGIVILNYNTWQESIQCVESIVRNTIENYHIYLVDNCSTDDSIQKLEECYKEKSGISFIKAEKNRGYSAGNNLGIRRAVKEGCDVVFVINSDVELLNNALDRMKDTLLEDRECMIVGPSILNNEGLETQLARKKLTWKLFLFGRHPLCCISYFKKKSERRYEIPEEGKFKFKGMVSGCCFGCRAEDMERLQYLDENVFLYYEEDILAYKIEKLHRKVVVDCEAKIWHKEGTSTKKKGGAFVQFHRWSSALYLLKIYVGITKWQQYFVVVSNLLFWILKSVIFEEYRKYLKIFKEKNISILRNER